MKKGISLIVLVITIIVMIIIAGAIILSLTNTNVIAKANLSRLVNDRSSLQELTTSRIAEYMAVNEGTTPDDISAAQGNPPLAVMEIPTHTKGEWVFDPAKSEWLFKCNDELVITEALAKTHLGLAATETLPSWVRSSALSVTDPIDQGILTD